MTVNYENGKIYKIQRKGGNSDIYIGSTARFRLISRLNQHKRNYKYGKSYPSLTKLFDNYGIDNCEIVLLEKYPCLTKKDLLLRETTYIKKYECVNIQCPVLSEQDKKALSLARQHAYYATHKNESKKYRELNKSIITDKNKIYRENNKEKEAERKKKWRLNNISTLKTKILCLCGKTYTYECKQSHIKTKHHIKDHEEFIRGCDEALKKYYS